MQTRARSRARLPRLIAIVIASVACFVIPSTPALAAHSQIISTSPVDGAVLEAPPAEVRITFDAPLLDDTDTISINDADGNVVYSAHPKPEGPSVAIAWPAGTKPGVYQIAYRIVCGDGHPEIGALMVTITGAKGANASSPASAAPSSVAAPAATGSALPLVIAGAVVVGALIAVGVVLVARRESSSH